MTRPAPLRLFLASLCLAISLLLVGSPALAQTFPAFTGLVVDAANVLPPATKADLTAKLTALQKDTNRQLVVATVPDLQGYPVEDFANAMFRAWGPGLKDANNGILLLVAPTEHRVRIEVGYGLEPTVTDALSGTIISEQMVPRLKANDFAGAVTAATAALGQQLRANPDEAKARTDAAAAAFDKTHRRAGNRSSGGGGFMLLFWGAIILFFVLSSLRRGGGSRYRGGIAPIILWGPGLGGGWGGGSDSGSGGGFFGGGGGDSGGGDGSWGGGGFTGGGGGSSGGGGASGSW